MDFKNFKFSKKLGVFLILAVMEAVSAYFGIDIDPVIMQAGIGYIFGQAGVDAMLAYKGAKTK